MLKKCLAVFFNKLNVCSKVIFYHLCFFVIFSVGCASNQAVKDDYTLLQGLDVVPQDAAVVVYQDGNISKDFTTSIVSFSLKLLHDHKDELLSNVKNGPSDLFLKSLATELDNVFYSSSHSLNLKRAQEIGLSESPDTVLYFTEESGVLRIKLTEPDKMDAFLQRVYEKSNSGIEVVKLPKDTLAYVGPISKQSYSLLHSVSDFEQLDKKDSRQPYFIIGRVGNELLISFTNHYINDNSDNNIKHTTLESLFGIEKLGATQEIVSRGVSSFIHDAKRKLQVNGIVGYSNTLANVVFENVDFVSKCIQREYVREFLEDTKVYFGVEFVGQTWHFKTAAYLTRPYQTALYSSKQKTGQTTYDVLKENSLYSGLVQINFNLGTAFEGIYPLVEKGLNNINRVCGDDNKELNDVWISVAEALNKVKAPLKEIDQATVLFEKSDTFVHGLVLSLRDSRAFLNEVGNIFSKSISLFSLVGVSKGAIPLPDVLGIDKELYIKIEPRYLLLGPGDNIDRMSDVLAGEYSYKNMISVLVRFKDAFEPGDMTLSKIIPNDVMISFDIDATRDRVMYDISVPKGVVDAFILYFMNN